MTIKEKWVRYNRYVHKRYYRAYRLINIVYIYFIFAIVIMIVLTYLLNLIVPFTFFHATIIFVVAVIKTFIHRRLRKICNKKLLDYFAKLNKEVQFISGGQYIMVLKKVGIEDGQEEKETPKEE